jgi:anti-anti-sigma factor
LPSHPFEIDSERHDREGRLRLAGEFDLATAPRVQEAAENLIAAELERLVIDLSGLGFIDSSGLRVIVVLHQRAAEEGWTLELVRPAQPVLKIFQISGLEERLHFLDGEAGEAG